MLKTGFLRDSKLELLRLTGRYDIDYRPSDKIVCLVCAGKSVIIPQALVGTPIVSVPRVMNMADSPARNIINCYEGN